ncbi:hypothetical protein L1049_023776 [Liquidambar formosana]|uniref:Uncharacterized protein n=1 Tax=Liquidambar formosana TaxID=63359 RepID=A0AAP0S0U3_LIQFO
MRMQVEDAENASSSERSEFDDDNGQATGDEYDGLAVDDYAGIYNGKSEDLILDESDDNVVGDEDDNDHDIEGDDDEDDDDDEEGDVGGDEDDEQGDLDVGRYINGYSDEEEGNRDEDEGRNGMPDEGMESSSSSDYSD